MNTKLFLLIGTSLSFLPQFTFAQCVATQDCATLGYTETSCSGGSGIKCPFGNKWACFKTDTEFCNEYGFTQTCTGENQSGGGSKACNGKYTFCNCSNDYAWKDGKCVTAVSGPTACNVGDLYYSDGTCSAKKEEGKNVLGVVIYSNGSAGGGWIMTTKPIITGIEWGYESNIKGLESESEYYGEDDLYQGLQNSCVNTDIITAAGNSSQYPAAWAAKNYRPEGTPDGKQWCLPSGGLLQELSSKSTLDKVNQGISKAGGFVLGRPFGGTSDYEFIWSSTQSFSSYCGDFTYENGCGVYEEYYSAWGFLARWDTNVFTIYGWEKGDGYSSLSVRPVMEF